MIAPIKKSKRPRVERNRHIESTEVERPKEPTAEQVRRGKQRFYCPDCDKAVTGLQVAHDPPERFKGEFVVKQTMYCGQCNHLVHWLVLARADGSPSSAIFSGPGIVRDQRKIDAFLEAHPECREVLD